MIIRQESLFFLIKLEGDSSEKVRRMCDFYPGSASRHTVMSRLQLGLTRKDVRHLSKILSQNVYVAYPRSAQAYGDAMDSNLGEPGKDINICLKFCLKMFVMLHIPEALRHTLMPWTST